MQNGPTLASSGPLRHDWTREEIKSIHQLPLPELIFQAQVVHREYHRPEEVQLCRLLSIKTGACPEDCAYCPQSAHYETEVSRQELMNPADVLVAAKRAKQDGATRFCMGAAWREVRDGKDFESVLEMVSGVAELGMEVCCTLGMLSENQAQRLKDAGLSAYNHNLDTSPEFYGDIITTRVYEDRLRTIGHVRKAGITVCCGGILGMGESEEDRIGLLQQLSNLDPHPESVPINMLVRGAGHASGNVGGSRSDFDGPRDRDCEDPDARFTRASGGGTAADVAGSCCALFSRGREFDFLRRKTPYHSQSCCG